MYSKRLFYSFMIVFTLTGIFFLFKNTDFFKNLYFEKKTYTIWKNKFNLYVADTEKKITEGLSVFRTIKNNEWMIFIFLQEWNYWFWMKDMKFDIDLLWIDKNWKIIWYINNFKKETYPEIFFSPKNIKYVIELNSQAIEKYNIQTWNIIVQSK